MTRKSILFCVSDLFFILILVENMPPDQRLLFGFRPRYFLTLIVAAAELALGHG